MKKGACSRNGVLTDSVFTSPNLEGGGEACIRYTVVIDSKELRTIMRESIDNTDLADSEKELWRQIFTLWEKTTRRGK